MIITRTPGSHHARGGGTDLPSFYEEYGGFHLLDVHQQVEVHHVSTGARSPTVKWSSVQPGGDRDSVDEIKHPLAREVLRLCDIHENIELTSIADMPARSGLGSSGAYLVGC
jgi:D-glycero-alpha-D-manno-heptose-7-phosphate kinase